jgi:methylglutaconyl-CoA hydratase
MPETIGIDRHDDIAFVTLNRPEVRNAFNETLVAELTAWARQASRDTTLRAAVLLGAGPVFCAGADLSWMSKMVDYSHEENVRDAEALAWMFEALDTLPVPLVGRVHGAALGGGAGLAAVCDIVIAADGAAFGFTEVKLGIAPAVISPYVVAKIGTSAARSLFLTGARFDAARALAIGLVHEVTAEPALDAAIERQLAEIRAAGPLAAAAAKTLVRHVGGRSPLDAMPITTRTIADLRASAEGQEGMRAFLGRRKASWVERS